MRRYSIHDGPGIRTTVFLKGCPLRCSWCQNPEGQGADPEIFIRPGLCVGCGECASACRRGAVSPDTRATDPALCARCGACVEVCPTGARRLLGRDRTVEDLLAEVERDRIFYDESGGGVTFSGGEPLMQPDFLREALEACRRRGLHIAVETCGHAPRELLAEVAARADLLLYDLKSMDSVRHLEATGVSNDLILENLRRARGMGAAVWVRMPLIPGFNDGDGDLRAVGEFVRSLPGRPPLGLIPYNQAAEDKHRRLGRRYALEGLAAPTPAEVRRAASLLESLGLVVALEG